MEGCAKYRQCNDRPPRMLPRLTGLCALASVPPIIGAKPIPRVLFFPAAGKTSERGEVRGANKTMWVALDKVAPPPGPERV